MLTRMSDSPEHRPAVSVSAEEAGAGAGDGRADDLSAGAGVLGGLPRTRPQRATPRRIASRASRSAGSSAVAETPAPSKRRPTKQRQPKKRSRSKRRGPAEESVPVPAQGYEAEPESLNGPVHPPGSTELVASAAELAGELAKTGVNTGVRVLRDLLSRLPG